MRLVGTGVGRCSFEFLGVTCDQPQKTTASVFGYFEMDSFLNTSPLSPQQKRRMTKIKTKPVEYDRGRNEPVLAGDVQRHETIYDKMPNPRDPRVRPTEARQLRREEREVVLSVYNPTVGDTQLVLTARHWRLVQDVARVNGYRATDSMHFLPAEGRVLLHHLKHGDFSANAAADREVLAQVVRLLEEQRGLRLEFRAVDVARVSVAKDKKARR